MSGVHRRDSQGAPVPKPARRLIAAGGTVGLLAAVVIFIHLLVTGTDELICGLALVLSGGAFTRSLVYRQQERRVAWMTGIVTAGAACQLLTAIAKQHHWPGGQRHEVGLVSNVIWAATLVILIASLVAEARSSDLGTFWRRNRRVPPAE
jgi:hypothetical protein